MILLGHRHRVGVRGDRVAVLARGLEGDQVHVPAVELEDVVEDRDVRLHGRQRLRRGAGGVLDRSRQPARLSL